MQVVQVGDGSLTCMEALLMHLLGQYLVVISAVKGELPNYPKGIVASGTKLSSPDSVPRNGYYDS